MEKKKYKWPINILENKPSLINNLGNVHYNETLFSIKLSLSVKRRSSMSALMMGRVQRNGILGNN